MSTPIEPRKNHRFSLKGTISIRGEKYRCLLPAGSDEIQIDRPLKKLPHWRAFVVDGVSFCKLTHNGHVCYDGQKQGQERCELDTADSLELDPILLTKETP